MRRLAIALAASVSLLVGAGAGAEATRSGGSLARVEATLACVARERAELDRVERLLAEARDQLRAHAAGSPEHADALRSAEALELRVAAAGRALVACAPPREAAAPAPAAAPAQAEATEAPRSSLDDGAVSGRVVLTDSLEVVRGLQVDGLGRVDVAALDRAIARVARPLHRCYEQAVDRGALVRGEVDVVFVVRADGRTLGHAIEGSTLGDPALEACIGRVARRVDAGTRAAGGDATFSYRLRFGPR